MLRAWRQGWVPMFLRDMDGAQGTSLYLGNICASEQEARTAALRNPAMNLVGLRVLVVQVSEWAMAPREGA